MRETAAFCFGSWRLRAVAVAQPIGGRQRCRKRPWIGEAWQEGVFRELVADFRSQPP